MAGSKRQNYLHYSPTIYGAITWKKDELSGYVQYLFKTYGCPHPKKKLSEKLNVRH